MSTIWALHGNLGHPDDWNGLRALLPLEDLHCPCLWENHPKPWDDFARDLAAKAAGDDRPVLLGYSLGARLAMHALVESETAWEAAVFVSGHPGLGDPAERTVRRDADTRWARLLREQGAEAFLQEWNAQAVLSGEPVPAEQGEHVARHADRIAAGFTVWSLGNQEDLRDTLAGCRTPQLWIAGERDSKFARIAREAATRIPAATYEEIEGSGHRVPLHNPGALAQCIQRFLRTPSE